MAYGIANILAQANPMPTKGNSSKVGLLIKKIEAKLKPPIINEMEWVILRLVNLANRISKKAKIAANPL